MPPVDFRSKKDYVYETLRRRILEGELEPGARLVIDELASSLGVSPIPVREALQQLNADGYVVIQPYIGVKVAEIHTESIFEIFAILEAMEVISGRAACERMTDHELDELSGMIEEMEKLTGHPEAWSHGNQRFHRYLCARARSLLVEVFMNKVLEHWDRLRRHYFYDVFTHRVACSQTEHREILSALRSRDPDQVEAAIREHNRTALAAYVQYLEREKKPEPAGVEAE